MPNQSAIVELVVYRIKPEMQDAYVTEAIEVFRKMVMKFDGFIRYDFYQNAKDANLFMDFVQWQTLEQAEAAAEAVKSIQQAPEFAGYLAAFEKLEMFSHFNPLQSWQ